MLHILSTRKMWLVRALRNSSRKLLKTSRASRGGAPQYPHLLGAAAFCWCAHIRCGDEPAGRLLCRRLRLTRAGRVLPRRHRRARGHDAAAGILCGEGAKSAGVCPGIGTGRCSPPSHAIVFFINSLSIIGIPLAILLMINGAAQLLLVNI